MGHPGKKRPIDWFEAAAHWYVEGHQGCVNCGACHCVFQSEIAGRIEYLCSACDFLVRHDLETDRYFVYGEGQVADWTALHHSLFDGLVG